MRLLIALLIAVTACAARAADAPGAVVRLDHADFVASNATEPPPDSAAWQPKSLPDDWDAAHAGLRGVGWYRVRFELTSSLPAKPAIYLPLMRNVGAVYLNGALVGSTGVFGHVDPGPAAPALFPIEPQQLRAGSNTLHIRLWSPQGRLAAIDAVSIGERGVFESELERERFMHVTLSQLAAVFSATVSLYTLVLWLHRRRDEVYGYFAAAALTHALFLITTVPIGGLRLMLGNEPACAVFWFASTVFLFIFSLRFAGLRSRRLERGVWLFALLMWISFAGNGLVPGQHWLSLASSLSMGGLYLAIPAASLIVLLRTWWQRRSSEALLLALCALYSVTVLTMSTLMPRYHGLSLGDTHIVPLFVVMGWILTRRFVRSLNETDALNVHLEERVVERHAELEREHSKLQALTREQAIGQERERIIADMHDGLGARLISTLGKVEQGDATAQQVATALRDCIDDLRLAIDSLQPTDDDLLSVLGNLRYRLENRLRTHGIALDWQVRDVPKLTCLTPRNVLHLLRILQEAFTNVVKHAQARHIRVATAVDAERVKIDVVDDGRGFDVDQAEGAGKGQGLAKMRGRAKTIGGDLLVMPTPAGTTLSLLLPRG